MSTTRTKVSSPPPKPGKASLPLADLAIGLALILAIFAVYSQVGTFDFTNYDDTLYVTENPQVQAGLTLASIRWAMTAVVASNWMPLTLLSHMLDCQLFHLQPGMHHLTNVALHLLATLLLFASLRLATGARWPSAFVALIFGIHPLHVESVAWIAERKDVLSACFWFLGMGAYVRYAKRPSIAGYLLVTLTFCLGLMAKPMLVTFPFTLLLLDVWPLRRWVFPRVVIEKLPLMTISAVASYVTFVVQRGSEAVQVIALPVRIQNSLIAYVVYLGQMLWPARLAVLYPYQPSPSVWQAVAAALLLLAISGAVIREYRTRPYLSVGWFWYLGTLVPVIGLVQVGLQARADRYLYIPMVGLLLMLAWGAADIATAWPQFRWGLAVAAGIAGVACLSIGHVQTEYWLNSETLLKHAIDVTKDNAVAEYNLGSYLMTAHRGVEAIPYFEAALRVHPNYPEAENNIGMVIGGLPNGMTEAASHFEKAVRMRPDLLEAQYNLAVALSQLPGRQAEAIAHYEIVQRAKPNPELAKIIERLRAEQHTGKIEAK